MLTHVLLTVAVVVAIFIEISVSLQDQDETDIRMIVKEIIETEYRNHNKFAEIADLKPTIHRQGESIAVMQNQIDGPKDVIIGQAQKLTGMDIVVKELKSTINGLKESVVAMEKEKLETKVTDTERQIRNKKENRDVFKSNTDTTSLNNDIRSTDNTTEKFKLRGKDQGKRKTQNRQSKITQRAFTSTGDGVAFSAYLSHDLIHMGIGHTVKCDKVLLNEGNNYSPFTGVFTAPQTGVYLLTFSIAAYNNGDM